MRESGGPRHLGLEGQDDPSKTIWRSLAQLKASVESLDPIALEQKVHRLCSARDHCWASASLRRTSKACLHKDLFCGRLQFLGADLCRYCADGIPMYSRFVRLDPSIACISWRQGFSVEPAWQFRSFPGQVEVAPFAVPPWRALKEFGCWGHEVPGIRVTVKRLYKKNYKKKQFGRSSYKFKVRMAIRIRQIIFTSLWLTMMYAIRIWLYSSQHHDQVVDHDHWK